MSVTNLFDPEKNKNTGDVAEAPQTPVLGPLSAVFDWNKEEEKIQAEREKAKENNQKIIKTNAIGEVFRALADTAGVAMGGTAKAAPLNQVGLQAFNDIKSQDAGYREQLERLSTRKLSVAQQELQAGLSREEMTRRENLSREELNMRAGEAEKQRGFEAEEGKLNRQQQIDMVEKNKMADLEITVARGKQEEANMRAQAAMNKDLTILKAAEDLALENAKNENTIKEYKARRLFESGYDETGQPLLGANSEWDISPPTKGNPLKKVSFVIPDTKKEVWFSPGMFDEIARQIKNKIAGPDGNVWAESMPPALRDIALGNSSNISSVRQALADNWDWVRDSRILPGPVHEAIYGVQPPTTATQSTQNTEQMAQGYNEKIDLILGGKSYHRSMRPAIETAAKQQFPEATADQLKSIVDNTIQQLIGK